MLFIKQAYAQQIPADAAGTIAVNGTNELFNYGVLGVFAVLLIVAVYLERKNSRQDLKDLLERQDKINEARDTAFLRATDNTTKASEKMSDAIANLSQELARLSGRNGRP